MARLLVTGAINHDRFVRIDRLVTGARIRGEDLGLFIGGAAANSARALGLAGHAVTLASVLGAGPRGDAILAELAAAGLDVSRVARPETPVPEPMILLDAEGERTILYIGQAGPGRRVWHDGLDIAGFHGDWDGSYIAAEAPGTDALSRRHLGRGPVVAQWSRRDAPPVAEVLIASQEAVGAEAALPAPDALGFPRWLVVTEGAAGARAIGRDGQVLRCPAAPVAQVVDTTGAGDVYAAGILHALVSGWGMAEGMALGAGLSAMQLGVVGAACPPAARALFFRAAAHAARHLPVAENDGPKTHANEPAKNLMPDSAAP